MVIFLFSTLKCDCPFTLAIRSTQDGMFLEVKEFNNSHNHEINKVCFIFSRDHRQISPFCTDPLPPPLQNGLAIF